MVSNSQTTAMEPDYLFELKRCLINKPCHVARTASEWCIEFDGNVQIWMPGPWRIVADGRVTFGSEDDGQRFGLPAPLDGEACANTLLANKKVLSVSINEQTGDIHILFDDAIQLDAFTSSRGYEGWRAYFSIGDARWSAFVLGGGEIAVFPA